MYSYEELKEIINDVSTDSQASKRKEVKELPHILRENEQIKMRLPECSNPAIVYWLSLISESY